MVWIQGRRDRTPRSRAGECGGHSKTVAAGQFQVSGDEPRWMKRAPARRNSGERNRYLPSQRDRRYFRIKPHMMSM